MKVISDPKWSYLIRLLLLTALVFLVWGLFFAKKRYSGEETARLWIAQVLGRSYSRVPSTSTMQELDCDEKDYREVVRVLADRYWSKDMVVDLEQEPELGWKDGSWRSLRVRDLYEFFSQRRRSMAEAEKEAEPVLREALESELGNFSAVRYRESPTPTPLAEIEVTEEEYEAILRQVEEVLAIDLDPVKLFRREPPEEVISWKDLTYRHLLDAISLGLARKPRKNPEPAPSETEGETTPSGAKPLRGASSTNSIRQEAVSTTV